LDNHRRFIILYQGKIRNTVSIKIKKITISLYLRQIRALFNNCFFPFFVLNDTKYCNHYCTIICACQIFILVLFMNETKDIGQRIKIVRGDKAKLYLLKSLGSTVILCFGTKTNYLILTQRSYLKFVKPMTSIHLGYCLEVDCLFRERFPSKEPKLLSKVRAPFLALPNSSPENRPRIFKSFKK